MAANGIWTQGFNLSLKGLLDLSGVETHNATRNIL